MSINANGRALAYDTACTISDSASKRIERQIAQLKGRLRIAVIFGGDKSAHDSVIYRSQNTRSWKSYESVACDIADSLRATGFHHVDVIPEDMRMADRLLRSGAHMAWLNTGGVQGYNSASHASAVLEMLGVPYVGHDPLSTTMLDNKHVFKHAAVSAGLPTSPFCTWNMTRGLFVPEMNSRFLQAFGDFRGPFIVKPVSGRASLHVHFAKDRSDLPGAVAEVYSATGNIVLIERYLPGREFCVAVAGRVTSHTGVISYGQEPFTFGVLERVFAPDELIFTSMDIRPITGTRFRPLSEVDEPKLFAEIKRLAREVYLELNLGSIIRIDLRCDENGNPCILEANPKPDLKRPTAEAISLIAAGLVQTNLSYNDLILSLFADRFDFLFRHRRGSIKHITDLLDSNTADAANLSLPPFHDQTDLMVESLESLAGEMRLRVLP
jgi:D-alanine-D-alanine ligase